jgi:DNA ligase-1
MSLPAVKRDISLQDALNYFSTHQTGADADLIFAKDFAMSCNTLYGADAMRLACAIITQDLKIGISATSLNKVYGADFIPKTGCMLGTLFENVGSEKTQWPCIVTEKLDGVRRILIKENGVCRFYSRSGHEDTGLVEILAEAKYLPNNFVYDGELLANGTFKDSIAQRQATNSIANLKGTKTGLTFNVFDMIPVNDFYAGRCNIPARERKIRLAATLNEASFSVLDENWRMRILAFAIEQDLKYIKPVPILGLAKCLSDVEPIVADIWKFGGEGVMLNTVNGPYEIKRSKQLLKIKHTEEFVLPVVDLLEGSGKYEDALGAIVVEYKGNKVGVGSGFTDAQRHLIWDNKERYIGLKAEIETFGESMNAQGFVSINCPIFKRFVGDE